MCRHPPHRELLSPRLVGMGGGMVLGAEGELVSPLLSAPVHIDPSCLHPDLLKEVQHVVIARDHLLLHLNQVIGRGEQTDTRVGGKRQHGFRLISHILSMGLHSVRDT